MSHLIESESYFLPEEFWRPLIRIEPGDASPSLFPGKKLRKSNKDHVYHLDSYFLIGFHIGSCEQKEV